MPLTAKEIMTTDVISINKKQTLQEAASLMAEHGISGLPVTDAEGVLIGIISNTDIIDYAHKVNVVPLFDLSGWVSPHTEIKDLASIRRGIDLLAKTTVGQLMKKKVYTAREDTGLFELARLMSRRQVNRVPIVDRENKLIGIVTRNDLVQNIARSNDSIKP
ncbi:MAG: CBS domain-containing protein [Dethiobacteria bacterium]|mgnify:CR=1 FL=1|nr:CBS domain-containing protein [Bacillota bacterium]NMD33607.1 CBS domain-containing protein [Bacillota bacterium]HOB28512.1 CBS domain-containing protein [Bacillota bacterium]HPZ41098.1 CBS domain-containing protein [Bacillota bacterium]HQD52191.1 CBS domain-containing protein [Bacillota bacterium]